MLLFFANTNLGLSKVKHVHKHASEQPESGVPAFVHHGRAGESCGVGNRSAVLRELGVYPSASNPEPEGKRSPEDEDEGDEERAVLPPATNQDKQTG